MPLAFDSKSHGTIAFGFFNIETDMLLLEHYFFFATEFCKYICKIAEMPNPGALEHTWDVHSIQKLEDIGDLMGAIHGTRYTGFIGEVYTRFPFPADPDEFKQKPEGYRNRAVVEGIIEKYASLVQIPFTADNESEEVAVGEYRFTRLSFQELLNYVWIGGYPRWKDAQRPDYVMEMKRTIDESNHPLFAGISFRE